MDFKKNFKKRLYLNIVYMIIGAALICIGLLKINENEMLFAFGIAFLASSIVRIIQYFKISKSEERLRNLEVKEKDERNVLIWTKAKSMTFNIYIMLSGAAIVALYLLNMEFIAQIVAYNICIFVVIYYVCYLIMNKKY